MPTEHLHWQRLQSIISVTPTQHYIGNACRAYWQCLQSIISVTPTQHYIGNAYRAYWQRLQSIISVTPTQQYIGNAYRAYWQRLQSIMQNECSKAAALLYLHFGGRWQHLPGRVSFMAEIGSGVRIPATTSSPCQIVCTGSCKAISRRCKVLCTNGNKRLKAVCPSSPDSIEERSASHIINVP